MGAVTLQWHYNRVVQTLLDIPKGLNLPGRKTSIFEFNPPGQSFSHSIIPKSSVHSDNCPYWTPIMISFWVHIKQPRQFHWAVAAQSGKPIMRGGGRVIKRQTGAVITRPRQATTSGQLHGAKSTLVLLPLAGFALAYRTRDWRRRAGYVEPRCSPRGAKIAKAFPPPP